MGAQDPVQLRADVATHAMKLHAVLRHGADVSQEHPVDLFLQVHHDVGPVFADGVVHKQESLFARGAVRAVARTHAIPPE